MADIGRGAASEKLSAAGFAAERATFPAMRLARDTDREIVTTIRGKRYTTSIEGTLTGLGANLVMIDDPFKAGRCAFRSGQEADD